MKVYTSYFNKVKNGVPNNCIIIPVSNTIPSWFQPSVVFSRFKLSPHWDLINLYKNGSITYEEFSDKYTMSLMLRINKEELLSYFEELCRLHKKDTIILVCHEKDSSTCHRAALYKWLLNADHTDEYQ
ncbi:MAG: DUF488 family protein [Lachnospiraceae bacterium]|nr:DUF488 family protein [Lachnospiraceae bacterium]